MYGGLAHLHGPGHGNLKLYDHLPYYLDNGAYPAFCHQTEWNEGEWINLIDQAKASGRSPEWALVPDVVGDKEKTLTNWRKYELWLRSYWGLPLRLSFAVQDGMDKRDVPEGASVVFVGGSTDWKWQTVRYWCDNFPHVHVGRVNGYKGLEICREAGAESCDGSGWFRGDKEQLAGLQRFLREQYERGESSPVDFGLPATNRRRVQPAEIACGYRQESLFDAPVGDVEPGDILAAEGRMLFPDYLKGG
jgi:hypothetical protein